MLKEKFTFLVPVILVGVSVVAADAKKPADVKKSAASQKAPAAAKVETGSPDLTVPLVNIGRQEILTNSDKEVSRANNMVIVGNYDEAIAIYNRIASELEPYSGETFKNRYDFCKKRIEYCYYQKAIEAMRKADDSVTIGDFEQAIKLCKEAIEFCPEKKDELEKKIAFYEKRRTAAVTREGRSIANLVPNYYSNNQKIELLIEQGRSLARRQEYMKAKRAFEDVLLLDPYNDVAMQNLLSVNNYIKNAADLRAQATQRRYIAMNKWAGAIPVISAEDNAEQQNQIDEPVVKVQESAIEKKLKSIRIPQISFVDQTFAEVMETLSNSCRRHSPGRTGINFVVKDNAAAMDDPQKAPRIPEYMKRDATVYEILEDLQKKHFLTYRIDRNAIFVAAAGIPLEKIEVKVFDVTLPVNVAKNIEETLRANGIQIDSAIGTSVKVLGNYVVARNTPAELKRIEEVLNEVSNDEPDMVQVMFKFLEVKQDDLDELAFNWQYSRNNTGGLKFDINGQNSLLRHYSYDSSSGGTRVSGGASGGNRDDANYYFTWKDGKNTLGFELFALDWADNSSILYAPRVTTLSGHLASIGMFEEHHYADEWEAIDAESTDRYRFPGTVQPDFEDQEKLGVHFDIKPEVNGERISAEINIPITQFKEWLIFDNGDEEDREYVKKPVFTQRTIKTNVTVRDGETVFIGGVVSDLTQTIDDKIPILGDIPLIGRLFQAKYTKSEKINLMVFMTCRIIKPDGSAKYPRNAIDNGLPVFPRNQ